MAPKTLAIAVATYNQGERELRGFVYGLLSQTSYDFKAYIHNDGPSIDSTGKFMEGIIKEYPDNFEYLETDVRENLYGHPGRQLVLDKCEEPFITFTNADNLIIKDYAKVIVGCALKHDPDVITNSIVHSYFDYQPFPGNLFTICQTDFTNFTVKSDKAKQVKLRIKEFAADGFYCDDFRRRFPNFKQIHIPCILAVHQ